MIFSVIIDSIEKPPEENVLATRPMKGLLWGDGQVFLKYQKVKFKHGKAPSLKRLQKFLEHEQAKDIKILSLDEFKQNTIYSTLMICSGMSPRHISRMAYGLLKSLKEAEVPDYKLFQVLGTRESGWMILSLRDLHIHLIVEDQRAALSIDEIWTNPISPKEIEEYRLNTYRLYHPFGKR
jgi:ribosomal silencing factor RsfS